MMQIAVILLRAELKKSPHKTENDLSEMPGILAELGLDEAAHYSSLCRQEKEYWMHELRRPICRSVKQAGWRSEAAITASGF
jgi:IS5 family transposase